MKRRAFLAMIGLAPVAAAATKLPKPDKPIVGEAQLANINLDEVNKRMNVEFAKMVSNNKKLIIETAIDANRRSNGVIRIKV